MSMLESNTLELSTTPESWPADVLALFNSIEHAFPPVIQRRKLPRTPYKRSAQLHLTGQSPIAVYTRDANQWTIGLIAAYPLATNQRGQLNVRCPDGIERQLRFRVIRSFEIRPGWYDAAIEFPTEDAFAEFNILSSSGSL